jgi:hypothetical protein
LLGRKTYTSEELNRARTAIQQQLTTYNALARSVDGNPKAKAALEAFEPVFFNTMAMALDRFFVHRLRAVTGKDTNPLNEVELLTEALMNHDGILPGNTVIKYVPDKSVAKIRVGEPIRLNADQFEHLADAFLDEIERKFL